jgi:two-component system response regulator DesR
MGLPVLAVGVAAADEDLRHRLSTVLQADGLVVVAELAEAETLPTACPVTCDSTVIGCARLRNDDLRLLQFLSESRPDSRIVVVARELDSRSVRRAFDAGADGLVREDQIAQCLSAAVRAVCAGQLTLPRELRAHWGKPRLSTREKQILGMVVMGLTNTQIARTLFVTESTVKSHLSSAFAKLGVRSRNEATDLILDPEYGVGTGILAISGEAEGEGRDTADS